MKRLPALLLPFALGGCIVASEKPKLDTTLIVPSVPSQNATAKDAVATSTTLTLPTSCWPSQDGDINSLTAPTGRVPAAPGVSASPPADAVPAEPAQPAALMAAAAAPAAKGAPESEGAFGVGGSKSSMSANARARNRCIFLVKSVIDESYLDYRLSIAKQIGLTNEGLDVGTAVSSATATATTGTANKVFSALTSVLTGSHTAFNNDALYTQSLQAVFKQMDADRLSAWATIQISMQGDIDAYPSEQADNDLVGYFRAGTVEAAVNSLDANAGTASTACKTASDTVANAVTSANQGASAKVRAPSAANTGQQTPGASTTAKCDQITKAASYALGELPAKPEDVISEAKTISANVFKISTSNKAELDNVARALGVPVTADFATESVAIRMALSKITGMTALQQAADRIKVATGRDYTSGS